MRKSIIVGVAAALAIALAPVVSQASHCGEIYVFTGPTDQVPQNPQTSGMINIGSAGCARPTAEVNTNYITPGAAFMSIGANGSSVQIPTAGQYKFDNGSFVNVTFTFDTDRSRWVTPKIAIPAGTTKITAKAVTHVNNDTQNNTVVYTTIGS